MAQGVQISDLAAGHTWEFNMELLFSCIKWASLITIQDDWGD